MPDVNVSCDELTELHKLLPPLDEKARAKAQTIGFCIEGGQILGTVQYYPLQNERALIIESPIVALSSSELDKLRAQVEPYLSVDINAELGLHITPQDTAHIAFFVPRHADARQICALAAKYGWAIGTERAREWSGDADKIPVSWSYPIISYGADRGEALVQIRHRLDRDLTPLGESHKELTSVVLAHDRFERGDMNNDFMAEEFPTGFDVVDLGIGHSRHIAAIAAILRARSQTVMSPSRWSVCVNNQFTEEAFTIELDVKPSVIFAAIDEDSDKATIEIEVKTDWRSGQRVAEMDIDGRLMIVQLRPTQMGYIITYRGGVLSVTMERLQD